MKHLQLIGFLLLLFAITNCEKKDITTGLTGTVKYGIGDCMPGPDKIIIYNDYNGKLFFIHKSDIDNQVSGDYNDLKTFSIRTPVINGKYIVELPIDTFFVMTSDVYTFSEEFNTVIIKEDSVIRRDYHFLRCTSF